MTQQQLVKAALAAKKKEAGESAAEESTETAAQETAEDKGKSLPQAGQNSAQGLPAPKKPGSSAPDATKGKAPFQPNLVKHPKGKAGKVTVPPKKPVGAVYWPKAKTR